MSDKALLNRLQTALSVSGIAIWEWYVKEDAILWDDLAYSMLGY